MTFKLTEIRQQLRPPRIIIDVLNIRTVPARLDIDKGVWIADYEHTFRKYGRFRVEVTAISLDNIRSPL